MDAGKLIRKIISGFHPASYLFIPVLQIKDRFDGGGMHKELERNIRLHTDPEEYASPAALRRLKRDMWNSFLLYHTDFDEYFMYGFPRLSHKGRCEFVTEAEKDAICRAMSTEDVWSRIWDKWSAYQLFQPYYRRDAINLDEHTEMADFKAFLEKHPHFIAKPRLESCGIGVTIFNAEDDSFRTEEVFRRLCEAGTICEELIRQADPFLSLHPSSVNTVRMATLVREDGPALLFSFLRIGRGASIVDNGGAGGYVALIDTEHGIVCTPGVTEIHETAFVHPDTGVQIIGLKIPEWDKLRALAGELAMVFPQHPYISWDMAYTDAGWVVVEANCMGQFIGPQFTTERGIRRHLSQYFSL